MLDRLMAAGDLVPLLFYLAIMVVWAVAKGLSSAKKGGDDSPSKGDESGPARPARPRRPALDPTLEDFLETITGQKLERREEPEDEDPRPVVRPRSGRPGQRPRPMTADTAPRPAPPPPRPVRSPFPPPPPPAPARPRAEVPAPVAQTARQAAAAAKEIGEPADFDYEIKEARGDVIERSEIGERDEVSGRAVLGSMSALAGLDAMRMPLPSLRLPHQPARRLERKNRVSIKGANNLRRALIERIILGPPPSINPAPLEIHPNVNK